MMFHAGRVRVREKRFWNVAKPYRVWGTISGAIEQSSGVAYLPFLSVAQLGLRM